MQSKKKHLLQMRHMDPNNKEKDFISLKSWKNHERNKEYSDNDLLIEGFQWWTLFLSILYQLQQLNIQYKTMRYPYGYPTRSEFQFILYIKSPVKIVDKQNVQLLLEKLAQLFEQYTLLSFQWIYDSDYSAYLVPI